MSCRQHPAMALDLVGSYKCLIFTLLSINFSRNGFCWGSWPGCLRVQGAMIWWWPESCWPGISQPEWKRSIGFFGFFSCFSWVSFSLCAAFLQLLSWVESKKVSHQCIFFLHIFWHILPKPGQDGFLVLYLFAIRVSSSSFFPLVYPFLLCIRFLSSYTSLGRLMVLAQLLFCIGNWKRKQLSLVLSASCKTHKCTMFTQERSINLCSNLSCTYLTASLFSLCTFSMENIASPHKPALTCNLRPCSRNPARSVCPCPLCQFYSHQIYQREFMNKDGIE